MILKAMGLGFVVWLFQTLTLRLAGHSFFFFDTLLGPDPARIAFFYVGAPLLSALLTFGVLKLLKEDPGDEAEAAVAFALPPLLLNIYAVVEFASFFPNLEPNLAQTFAALAMLQAAAALVTGLLTTRISPKDEQL